MEKAPSSDGTEIAFDRSGAGPPLVLVVGAFSDRSSMKAVEAGLRDAFTVYAYDRRGRGDSANTPPYAVEREVEDLAAVIELAGEPAFVFGQSSGGALVLEAAAASVPIRALVVNEPPYTDGPTVEFAPTLSHEVRLCNNGLVPTERVGKVAGPTLALAGENSPPWAHDGGRAIADAAPRGQARVLAGQSHRIDDDLLISVLKEFFV